MWLRLERQYKKVKQCIEKEAVKAGQFSVVNDLQLIRPMCSACENAVHVVTAWKTGLLWMEGW